MRHKLLIVAILGLLSQLPLMVFAQKTFTQKVMDRKAGEGKVVIHTDAKIDSIINNTKPEKAKATHHEEARTAHSEKEHSEKVRESKTGHKENSNSEAENRRHERAGDEENATHRHPYESRARVRQTGYRIQIYTGGNSHQDKNKAYNIGAKCRRAFPELSSYPRFMSPRWICRVGDFRTREEALKYVGKIRARGISREAHVVRCEVLLPR